jgi:hypothetical protein
MKPRLVIDKDSGKLCMQVCMGHHAATLELPSYLQKDATEAELSTFMEEVVPEMVTNLRRLNQEDAIRNKWKKGFHG